MATESRLQTEIIKYLKKRGCYVIKTKPGPGVPVGCPDIIFLFEGFYGAIEAKASKTSPYQPLQKEALEKLNNWSWAKRVDPSNWDVVRLELDSIL